MPLIHSLDPNSNWHDVLALWHRVSNWPSNKPTQKTFERDLRQFTIALWSEKDWLVSQYPARKAQIESYMSTSEPMAIVADLANTAKHRVIHRSRSSAQQTDYKGKVMVSGGATRQLHYLQTKNGKVVEVMSIMRKALNDMENFRLVLRIASTTQQDH